MDEVRLDRSRRKRAVLERIMLISSGIALGLLVGVLGSYKYGRYWLAIGSFIAAGLGLIAFVSGTWGGVIDFKVKLAQLEPEEDVFSSDATDTQQPPVPPSG